MSTILLPFGRGGRVGFINHETRANVSLVSAVVAFKILA
jgi:hypothetical protein